MTNKISVAAKSAMLTIAAACSSGVGSESQTAGLEKIMVSDNAKVHKKQVLVYYANETVNKGAYSDSYNKIVTALKTSGEVLKKLGIQEQDQKKVEMDLKMYGQRVEEDKSCLSSLIDFEVQNIQKNICGNPKNKYLGLAVFRSTLMQEKGGLFMYCKPQQGAQIAGFPALSKAALTKVFERYPVAKSNPASYSGTLIAALNQTAAVFDMKDTSINLVIRSHGLAREGAVYNRKTLSDLDSILVSPRIPIMWESLPGETDLEKKTAVVKLFLDNMRKLGRVPKSSCPSREIMSQRFSLLGSEGFSAEGFSAEGFSAEGFSAEGFSAEGFSTEGFKTLSQASAQAQGWITKRFLLQTLERSNFSYPVVLTESCDSYWGKVIRESGIRLPNVKMMIGAQEKKASNPSRSTVDYLNVNYIRLFNKYFNNTNRYFSDSFVEEILLKP